MSKSVFIQCDGAIARVATTCTDDKYLLRIKFDQVQVPLPVTGFALEMGGNYQFLHTVSEFVYFYAFGDRISELNITGMAFIASSCRPRPGEGQATDSTAITDSVTDVYKYYKEKRTTNPNKSPKAISLTLGNDIAFWAFLTGMRMEIARADVPLAQWVMRLQVIPKN